VVNTFCTREGSYSINDLDLNVHNVLLKFADDTKICSRICNSDDVQRLQEDLNTLQEWARTWQMQFNIQKCKVMRVGDSDSGLKRLSIPCEIRSSSTVIQNVI